MTHETCKNCQFFRSRQDGTLNGWCSLFDKAAKETHPKVTDCNLEIFTNGNELIARMEKFEEASYALGFIDFKKELYPDECYKIILGCDNKFWVGVYEDTELLNLMGYEYAEF
jgi:hypothetical protein